MTKLQELKKHLRPGQVYRRGDLAQWSNAVDRHIKQLQGDGILTKLAPGLYSFQKATVFGKRQRRMTNWSERSCGITVSFSPRLMPTIALGSARPSFTTRPLFTITSVTGCSCSAGGRLTFASNRLFPAR